MMDRHSWLWRRKSSEKSPGETESSGSISSHSERFSGEQVYIIQNTQSHEVTSKTMVEDAVTDDDVVKSLKEKLADALSQARHKEDSAKQHAKVAEEAVAGWEKAENEVLSMRQELEAATQKNLALEDRMSHLDGALKECVRQLRQAKEEQDQMSSDAVTVKTQEWETQHAELQSQIAYYAIQHSNSVAEMNAAMEKDCKFQPQLDALSTENLNLKQQLLWLTEEMKVITLERDYSIQAAETASKQRLESSRKIAKLEAESLRLKSLARKAALFNENQSVAASSMYEESITDNQSHYGDKVLLLEADLQKMGILEPKDAELRSSDSSSTSLVPEIGRFKNEKPHRQNTMISQVVNELTNDFFKVERMVAIPDPESKEYFGPDRSFSSQPYQLEITLKSELECMTNRTSELEEKLENAEARNVEVNEALVECQNQLKISETKLRENEVKLEHMESLNTIISSTLAELEKQLQISQIKLKEYAEKWMEMKTRLALANESKQAAEDDLRSINAQREGTESRLVNIEAEKGALLETVRFLEAEIKKERSASAESRARYQILEDELLIFKSEAENKEKALLAEMNKTLVKSQHLEELMQTKTEAELNRSTSKMARDFDVDQEKELQIAAQQFAECQKTIASVGRQLKSLATLEDSILDYEKSTVKSDPLLCGQEQGKDLSDQHLNKVHLANNNFKPSISEANHSCCLQNQRDSGNSLKSDSTHVSGRGRSGFGKLSSRGKTRR